MKLGTKSVLFGVHCFFLHPIFVAIAWIKLYGFPWDPRIWIAFFVHDLGYLGKPNMDGPEGEKHVELGARIMGIFGQKWHDFSLYHSRYYAKKHGAKPSKLCFADKLSICVPPRFLYLLLANATGEIKEYLQRAKERETNRWEPVHGQREWYDQLCAYMRAWVSEHKDGREDTWTNAHRNNSKLKNVPGEYFIDWADEYFHGKKNLNKTILPCDIQNDYRNCFRACSFHRPSFKYKLALYCEWKGFIFTSTREDGIEYFSICEKSWKQENIQTSP